MLPCNFCIFIIQLKLNPRPKIMLTNQSVITDIKAIIAQMRENAIRAVDHQRTLMYWHIGKCIFEEEQKGSLHLVFTYSSAISSDIARSGREFLQFSVERNMKAIGRVLNSVK